MIAPAVIGFVFAVVVLQIVFRLGYCIGRYRGWLERDQ